MMLKRNVFARPHWWVLILALSALLLCWCWTEDSYAQRTAVYYPAPGDKWERRKPEQVGLNPALLAEAVEFAQQQKEPKSVAQVIAARQRQESHPEIIGLTKECYGRVISSRSSAIPRA
jgi:hypothetical protein